MKYFYIILLSIKIITTADAKMSHVTLRSIGLHIADM